MQPAPIWNFISRAARAPTCACSHASCCVVGLGRLRAVVAHAAHQALRDDAVQRRRDHVAGRAHVEQAIDGRDGVHRVQRREHQVAGDRGAQADLGGFLVAHFADQDDVRILAQRRAQDAREVEADLGVDLHLVDAVEAVFDRDLRR